jgi:hypothetical protein
MSACLASTHQVQNPSTAKKQITKKQKQQQKTQCKYSSQKPLVFLGVSVMTNLST